MWKTFKNLSAFQKLIVIIVISAIISQLSINAYYELYGSLKNLDERQKADIKDIEKSPIYSGLSVNINNWTAQKDQLEERNKTELSMSGKLRHVDNIKALNDSISQANVKRLLWINGETKRINTKYAEMKTDPLARWGGFGLIFVFEFLALGFGFLSPRRHVKFQQYLAIALSVYAQFASCMITERGLTLLVGDSTLAGIYAYAFMIQIPAFYWLGGLDIEEYGKQITPSLSVKAPDEIKAKVTERTESIEFSKKHTISEVQKEVPVKPSNPDEAIDLYAQKKISADNGWSQRRIAKEYFGGKLTEVNNRIKRREIELAKFEIV